MTALTPAFFPNRRKRDRDASPLPRHGPQSHARQSQRPRRWFLPLPPEARSSFAFDMGNYISSPFGRPNDDGLGLFSRWVRKSRDLTVAMDEEAGTGQHLMDRRRVEDARKVTLEAEAVKPPQWKKRRPHYKEAYEATTQHDRRLEEIGIELRFHEEKLAEIQKLDKAAKEDLSELFKPLPAEEENELRDCFHSRDPSSKVLVLHEPSNIEVSKEKFQCLRPRCWLNDEVINLYLELLKEREKREPNRFLKCHFFNTFFYKKTHKKDRVRNEDIRDRVGVAPIEEKLIQHRLRWFGHVQRRPPEAPVRSGVLKRSDDVRRGRGRPKLTWDESVKRDFKKRDISKDLAMDRSAWRLAINVPEP